MMIPTGNNGTSYDDYVKALSVVNAYLRDNPNVRPEVILKLEPDGEYYYKVKA